MPARRGRLFLVHWKATEAEELAAPLRAAAGRLKTALRKLAKS